VVSKALREERQQPRRWFYLSFVDNYGFLGAAVARQATASTHTNALLMGPSRFIKRITQFIEHFTPVAHQ